MLFFGGGILKFIFGFLKLKIDMCRCSLFVRFLVFVCVCVWWGVEFILFGIIWAFGMVFDFNMGRTLLIIITHCFKYFFCSIPFFCIVSLAL